MDKFQFNCLVISHSEISIKKGNRKLFEAQLSRNIGQKLKREGFNWQLEEGRNIKVVKFSGSPGYEEIDRALNVVAEVQGVRKVSPALWLPSATFREADQSPRYDMIRDMVIQMARNWYREGTGFAVKVRRTDKTHTCPSEELERWLGAQILEQTPWEHVDLKSPDRVFLLRFYKNQLYITTDHRDGPGGLPVGTGGSALALLSGGFDSPVASWLMSRRGCRLDFIHFSASHPHPEFFNGSKMDRLSAWLSRFTLNSRLYVVPYTHFDLTMPAHDKPKALMVFRRFMSRVAQKQAKRCGAQALVTGESLSQVASQTLENLVANHSVLSMPVFQPLIGYTKEEIIELSRKLGCYELAVEPYKDCCSLISSNPEIKTKSHILDNFENKWIPDYDNLINRTLDDTWCVDYEAGKRVDSFPYSADRGKAVTG